MRPLNVVYSYTCRCKQKHNDDFNERTNTFLYKKYTSYTLFSKGLRKGCERVDVGYVWEVSWRQRQTATYWTQVPLTIAALLSHSTGLLNRGSLRSQALCLELVLTPRASYLQLRLELTPSNWLKLTAQAVCGTWLYNCLTPTCFLWAYASAPNSTTSTGQGDIPIPSTGCTCFVSWVTGRSRVNI